MQAPEDKDEKPKFDPMQKGTTVRKIQMGKRNDLFLLSSQKDTFIYNHI